jgi:hypothetical protein
MPLFRYIQQELSSATLRGDSLRVQIPGYHINPTKIRVRVSDYFPSLVQLANFLTLIPWMAAQYHLVPALLLVATNAQQATHVPVAQVPLWLAQMV